MHIPTTIIVMGRSGSGKGTQIELLKEAYLKQHPGEDILYFYPGSVFRNIAQSGSHTGAKIKEDTERGVLVPDFITNGLFVGEMIEKVASGDQLFIFDGYPRNHNQMEVLEKVLRYYGREHAVVLHIKVSEEEVRARMASRGRYDDQDAEVLENRMHYYQEQVEPVIEQYRNNNNYLVIDIDGVGDINDIHHDIMEKLASV
ncbi:nucleoside monophosphate kinase [Patescibacteria group bacterium]|nr:nucleoside monophosphate kinase [Patescibacteria group bacterium]